MPDRVHRNASLEARRLLNEQRAKADAALRAAKVDNRSPLRQIELGFEAAAKHAGERRPPNGPVPRHGLRERVAHLAASSAARHDRGFLRSFRDILNAAAVARSPLLSNAVHVAAMARLAESWRLWLRAPKGWEPRTHNAARQFSSLARHLLADYPVPIFFDAVWTSDDAGVALERRWFAHVGRGHNLRTAESLPFALTKAMAHHALLAPDDVSVLQALRWGQVFGLGGGERLARAVIGSRLGRHGPVADHEPFWLTALQFFANHPMLDPNQVGPIVDYLHAQRFEPQAGRVENGVFRAGGPPPQPNLTMKGRTPDTLLRQVAEWHRRLARETGGPRDGGGWSPSGVAGYERVEGEAPRQRLFTVVELLDGKALFAEGRAMGHCVGTYAWSCQRGRCAIFSLREDAGLGVQRRLTVEVSLPTRTIVQARGRRNRMPQPLDERVLRGWATVAGLKVAGHVMA